MAAAIEMRRYFAKPSGMRDKGGQVSFYGRAGTLNTYERLFNGSAAPSGLDISGILT